MRTWFKIGAFFVAALATYVCAATPAQTVKDSMNGNWAVINGQKRFMSGMNIAWINFGSDVGDKSIDIGSFTDKIKQIRKAGGNIVRWWIHTDAQNDPKIDATGAVTGLGANTIKNLRSALDTAYAYGVVVDLCLFSFDMLVPGTKTTYSSYNLDNNYKFLTDTSKITTYLNNGLKPILDSLGSHPAVMCFEAFNEPEGMLASANWTDVTKKISQNDILRITNRIAGFVHRNSKKMASTGLASFQYCGEYSKAKLIAAGGDQDGYLDFYMAHYYPEWQDASICPFSHPASFWNMDRPILIGEYPAKSWSTSDMGKDSKQPLKTSMTINDTYTWAYDNGYAGGMSWSMTEQNSAYLGSYETTAPALTAIFNAHKNDIMIKDVTIIDLTGDLCMQAALDLPAAIYPEAEYNISTVNFTGVDSLLVDLYLPPGTEKNIKFQFVMKSTSDWIWCPSGDYYAPAETGKWLTYSVPVSDFRSGVAGKTLNLADIRQIVLQFMTAGTSTFKANVFIDNVRYKKGTTETIISDFNKAGSTWSEYESGTNDNVQLSLAEKPGNTSVITLRSANSPFSKIVTMNGRELFVNQNSKTVSQIRIFDVMGKALISSNVIGSKHAVDCGRLAAGNYLVEVVQGSKSVMESILLQ